MWSMSGVNSSLIQSKRLFLSLLNWANCYELKFLEWNRRTALVLSNTRELDRDLFTN